MLSLNSLPKFACLIQDARLQQRIARACGVESLPSFRCDQGEENARRMVGCSGDEPLVVFLDSPVALDCSFVASVAATQRNRCLLILISDDIGVSDISCSLETSGIDRFYPVHFDTDVLRSDIISWFLKPGSSNSVLLNAEPSVASRPEVYRILLVDDETRALKYLIKQLQQIGNDFEFMTAGCAEQALSVLSAEDSDIAVVMSDQRMPGESGHQLLRKIRARHPAVVTILSSAYGEVDVAMDAVNHGGIVNYISKPWNAQEVYDRILKAAQAHDDIRVQSESTYKQRLRDFNGVRIQRRESLLHGVQEIWQRTEKHNTAFEPQQAVALFLDDLQGLAVPQSGSVQVQHRNDAGFESSLVGGLLSKIEATLNELTKTPAEKISVDGHKALVRAEMLGDNSGFQAIYDQLGGIVLTLVQAQFFKTLIHYLESPGIGLGKWDLNLKPGREGGLKPQFFGINCEVEHPVLLKHFLSPMTMVPPHLLDQQATLLSLYLLVKALDGDICLQATATGTILCIVIASCGSVEARTEMQEVL